MTERKDYTGIPLLRNTWIRLNRLKNGSNTWDDIVNNLLDQEDIREKEGK
jgi:hypothetical protein